MHRTRTTVALAVLATSLALVAVACGSDDEDTVTAAPRTIEVEMRDIAFSTTELRVEEGETVTFRFANVGKVAHDAFVGDTAAQQDHEEEMEGDGDMHHGDDDEAVTVEPGESATLTHTFDEAGTIEIGCHQPGHYAAGMKVMVEVA